MATNENASEPDLDGGFSGDYPSELEAAIPVAPTAEAGLFNTIASPIIPIACWRLDDIRFEFGSSFVKAEVVRETKTLRKLMHKHPGASLSVFGHADPVGNDDFNKQLSGRRAAAIYGLLIRDTGLWKKLYDRAGDDWGIKAVQQMLRTLGHDPGPIDGVKGEQTREAVRSFQEAAGLAVDGDPGPQTLGTLIPKYMDALCVDEAGNPFRLDKSEFLAQGRDPDGKGDFQGCSEFNPVLMFSADENQEFSKDGKRDLRNAANEPNRRVVILLFRPGSKVDPKRWPCPRAFEGKAGCQKRFWSDSPMRRKFQAERRDHDKTKDTFACRFYDRLTSHSPCEKPARGRVRVLLDDPYLGFLADVEVRAKYATGSQETLVADAGGVVRVLADQGSFVDLEFATELREHALRIFLALESIATPAGAWQRLVNLGFVDEPQPPEAPPDDDALVGAIADFQSTQGMVPTGVLDSGTQSALTDAYDSTTPWGETDVELVEDDKLADSASSPKDALA